MSKVAFCFLVVDNINQDLLWKDYFYSSNQIIKGEIVKRSNVYIHRVYPDLANDCLGNYTVNWQFICERGK